jgi:hypothetical protein
MTIRYIDFNRGSDASDGSTPALAWKNIAMMSNFQPNAGGGIYLASDSIWNISQTLASSGSQSQTRFNGTESSRAFISAYTPFGGDAALMPTISRKYLPVESDWLWDSTLDYGVARGWYLQFAYGASQWDIMVEINGIIVETTNQDTTNNTGLGHINGTQTGAHIGSYSNGMTYDTLRFNFDYSGTNVAGATGARLYLSGLGLHSLNVGFDPSSVYGPNTIKVAFNTYWSFWDSLNYTTISGVKVQNGGGLLLYQATADTVRQGFELTGCKSYDTTCPVRINSGTGSVNTTQWDMDIHDNDFERLTGPALIAYGVGVTGYFRKNTMTNGNLASSMGGGVYMQLKPSMVGGTKKPFRVESNIADTWKNGAGNNTWDGGCYYADIQDEGTIFRGNTAKNSFVAFQCGSGSRSEWYANKSINCEYFGLFNNALSMDKQDYVFAHNLHVAAALGTFTHGESATVHPYSFAVYSSGSSANFVGGKFVNNVLINHPSQPNQIPLMGWVDSQWQSGKVTVSGNVFIGYSNSRLVVSDFNVVDKTSVSNSIITTVDLAKFNSNYVPSVGSSLTGVGLNMDGVAIFNDFSGARYNEPATPGPHITPTKRDYLSGY